MSLEKVRNAVLAEAEADARRTLEKARREAEALLAEGRSADEKALEEAARLAEARAARDTARELGRARHEGRLQVLRAKNDILDAVFQQAAEALSKLPEKQYMDLLAAWLKALPPATGGVLRVGAGDAKRFTAEFLQAINSSRPKEGRFTEVVPDPAVAGGFIVEGPDFTADCTIRRRFAELRDAAAGELAKELFKK